MQFHPFLELTLTHPYYRDGGCPDFLITPAADTRGCLDGHRHPFAVRADRVDVRFPADGTAGYQPLIPLSRDVPLRFHLTLQNPEFPLFTDLSGHPKKGAALYRSPSPSNPLQLERAPMGDGERAALPRDCFAVLELWLPELDTAVLPLRYELRFTPRAYTWAYYCVTDQDDAAPLPIISDGEPDPAQALRFDAGQILSPRDGDADGIARTLADRYPGQRVVRVLSGAPVPCQKAARRLLSLKLQEGLRFTSLPNPSLRNGAPADRLYQILKYRTKPY